MERLENLKLQIAVIVIAEIVMLLVMYLVGFQETVKPLALFMVFNIVVVIWILYSLQKEKENRDIDISRILGKDAKDAFVFGQIGIITYDDNFVVTWVNEFMMQRELKLVGKKVTSWIPDLHVLLNGESDSIVGAYEDQTYEVTHKENGHVLYVRDITEITALRKLQKDEEVVIGLIHLDNYMDISQYEDETKMALINTNLRQAVVEWAKGYGMLIRRLRSDRFLVVLDKAIYEKILEDKFSILNKIRNNADEIDVAITLSMSFAGGTSDYQELDTMVNDLLELALSRGGDQVAVKRYGENVRYFGGNSEAKEKRSRVRVRVMAQAIRETIEDSERVFVVGHRLMDFDCMGSALGMSRIVQAYGRKCYIVSKSGGIEEQLNDALHTFNEALGARHQFISDMEACKMADAQDLVIAVDHHNPDQCGAPDILRQQKRKIVIDHHRRSENFIDDPLLVYVETGASSVSELITELLPYQTNKVHLSEEEATVMYLGILIDTNRFKARTGSRTFEAVAQLKKLGVDSIKAENLLKENFEEFEERAQIMKYAKRFHEHIVIACVSDNRILNRTMLSKVADNLLNIKGVDASFVLARTDEKNVAISARSSGSINVQIIMEAMQGGGHFSAAALQRESDDIASVNAELEATIEAYLTRKDEENESNSVK